MIDRNVVCVQNSSQKTEQTPGLPFPPIPHRVLIMVQVSFQNMALAVAIALLMVGPTSAGQKRAVPYRRMQDTVNGATASTSNSDNVGAGSEYIALLYAVLASLRL